MTFTNPIEAKFASIEASILNSPSDGHFPITSAKLSGIEFKWVAKPLKQGGTLRRKGVYGYICYTYRGRELTRDEAIQEYCKPIELRQALVEAEAVVECSICGKIVVGKEALNPYQTFDWTNPHGNKRAWGLMFYHMNPDRINESIDLSVCPDCMDAIYQGKFRKHS